MNANNSVAILVGSLCIAGAVWLSAGRTAPQYQLLHHSGPIFVRLNTTTGATEVCRVERQGDDGAPLFSVACPAYRQVADTRPTDPAANARLRAMWDSIYPQP